VEISSKSQTDEWLTNARLLNNLSIADDSVAGRVMVILLVDSPGRSLLLDLHFRFHPDHGVLNMTEVSRAASGDQLFATYSLLRGARAIRNGVKLREHAHHFVWGNGGSDSALPPFPPTG
jgi:hypothetical protein